MKSANEGPMTASSEMVLVDDFFEQFPSPTLRIVRSAEAHPEGSPANASPQSPTARRQPPPADRTAQADDNPDCGQRFRRGREVSFPDRPGPSSIAHPPPRAFENRINLEQFLASVTHLLSHIPSCARHAFSTQAPNRADSPSLSGIALGSITARNALSVTSLGGAARRRAGLGEYFATGATRKASSGSARVGDGFQGAGAVQLPLDLLQR